MDHREIPLHTSWSSDTGGTGIRIHAPEQAYRFARGEDGRGKLGLSGEPALRRSSATSLCDPRKNLVQYLHPWIMNGLLLSDHAQLFYSLITSRNRQCVVERCHQCEVLSIGDLVTSQRFVKIKVFIRSHKT